MRSDKIKSEIDKLGLSEKIMLVEDVWDSIAMSNSLLPFPEWQKAELEKRYGEYKNGRLDMHDWKGVHDGLREKYK